MKKRLIMIGMMMSLLIYAKPIERIQRVDLVADGVLFNQKDKLLFGSNIEDIVALLGDYEGMGYGDLPHIGFEMPLYEEQWGLWIHMINRSIIEAFPLGFWDIIFEKKFDYQIFIEDKELYIGQDNDEVKKLLVNYEIIKIYDFKKGIHERIIYAVGRNYLSIDYNYDSNSIIKIGFARYTDDEFSAAYESKGPKL